jgi:hypothetical protein
MHDTPMFPRWQRRWALPRLAGPLATLRRCTLDQLEDRLGPLLAGLPALAGAAAPARERPYSVRRTWWCFLWQMLQRNAACRTVVRQLQAMLAVEGRPLVDEGTSGYCQARARVPLALCQAAFSASAQAAIQRAGPSSALQGRAIKVIDGTTLVLPDTPANQGAYPQSRSQAPGCGFPQLNLLVVWHAASAALIELAHGDQHHSEQRLLHALGDTFATKDILVYDRAAGHYVAAALLAARGVDLISRVHTRRVDWRRGQRLGADERQVDWPKSRERPPYLSAAQWDALPAFQPVRLIRVLIRQKGFRTRVLGLVTTLLDAQAYPAAEIAAAYLRRWRLEMCLDDLKTTLGLDALRCQSPAMIERELLMLLTTHNLVRAVMAEAGAAHGIPIERLSFTGSLAALRTYCAASAQVRTAKARSTLWSAMLRAIAADPVPLRPNRWEPRAVKRRPKSYPPLNRPRHLYRQRRHGSLYRRVSIT